MDTRAWAEELSPEVRAVLEAGRRAAAPASERRAVWRALGAKLPAAAAATAVTKSGLSLVTLAKPFALGLLLGVVATTGTALVRGFASTPPAPAPNAAVTRIASPPPKSTSEREPGPAVTAAPEPKIPPPARGAPIAAVPDAATSEAVVPAPGPSSAAFPPEAPTTAAPENAVLVESRRVAHVRALLQQHDTDGALTELDALDRTLPGGVLAQEREALRIEALLARGDRARAREEARRFLARHPESPHAQAVERALE
ncbi:MAG TPA: hypothetical protein VMI54_10860 [Polyangiaceae bacterium]|nr:hypothetical protein [Polyangiaceae bacterium]